MDPNQDFATRKAAFLEMFSDEKLREGALRSDEMHARNAREEKRQKTAHATRPENKEDELYEPDDDFEGDRGEDSDDSAKTLVCEIDVGESSVPGPDPAPGSG